MTNIRLPYLLWVIVSILLVQSDRGHAGEEIAAGQLQFRGEGGEYTPALHLDSQVHFRIAGMVAHVELKQSFSNPGAEWREGRYVFPLPEEAAVNRMRMKVGEREIIGEIREREKARAEYRKARAEGRKASLTEQHRPNLFSNRVANIAPGETVTIELSYVQTLDYRDGLFSLRFPTTLTARYIPGQPKPGMQALALDAHSGWAHNTDRVADASEITPQQLPPNSAGEAKSINPIAITAELEMGLPLAVVESRYHDIVLERSDNAYNIALASGKTPMDRDFVLQWRAVTGGEPQAALFRERVNGVDYELLMVVPPRHDAIERLPREMVFVIDTSGSMGGEPIRQARASLQFGLTRLHAGDTFNIVEFNSSARSLFQQPLAANDHNLSRAREFVRHLQAGGGTEMRSALQLALRDPEASTRVRQVVFITDGAVGNEAELFREIEGQLGNSRLFTVGIGSAPNSWFMRKAARFGRGTFTYVSRAEEVQEMMERLFTALSHPLVTDLEVDWGATAEMWPPAVPELYRGEPLLVAARLADPEVSRQVTVRGRLQGRFWQRQLWVETDRVHPGVATTWARRKISSLLDSKVMGRPEVEVRADVLPLALEHQLVSPYTSFIALEKKVSRPDDASLKKTAVPNASPAGQAPQAYAWPSTGTGAASQLLLGGLLLLSWLVLLLLQRGRTCLSAPW